MKKLENHLIFLLIYLMIFFSLDKITIGFGQPLFGFSRYYYALILVSVLLIVSVPFFQRAKLGYLLVGGGFIYVVGKLIFFRGSTLSIQFPYLILTELFIYFLGIFYANRLGTSIVEMGNAIKEAILPNPNQRIYKKEKAGFFIENEFVRGRRYNYPITALVVEPDTNIEKYPSNQSLDMAVNEIQQRIKTQYVASKFTDIICNQIRLSDMIVELDESQGKYLIICPELSYENSTLFGERLRKAVKNNLGVTINYGVLNFPKDVLTFEAMLDKAEYALNEPKNTDV